MFDVRFKIKVIEPVMIKSIGGVWINLQYLKLIWSTVNPVTADGFAVVIKLEDNPKKHAIVLMDGFESQEQADKYIDDLLDTLHSIRGRS